jgi:hypothetical protein
LFCSNEKSSQVVTTAISKIQFDFVDVAPAPAFPWFYGAHDGVLGLVEVFGGVFSFRGVAAADVSAGEAHAQMNPAVTGLEALFAATGMWKHILNLVEVGTFTIHTG